MGPRYVQELLLVVTGDSRLKEPRKGYKDFILILIQSGNGLPGIINKTK